jgi:hypothetical protein
MLHISLDLFMLKKRQEKKIHVFEYMREAQVHIWADQRTSTPTSSRIRTTLGAKEI